MKHSNETKAKNQLTVRQSIGIGSLAGAAEVLVNHPLWTIKTRLQAEEPFSFNPRLFYRGIVPNALSLIPITATQVGLTQAMQTMRFNGLTDLSDTQKILSAFVGGVGAALIACPTEMVMTYQTRPKAALSFYGAAQEITQTAGYRSLYRGLVATMMRDGIFSACLWAGMPMLKSKIVPYCQNDFYTSLAAGMGAGIMAAGISQGVDTLKTAQQSAALNQPQSLVGAVKNIHSKSGIYGFFRGSIPRGARVVSAVTIMGSVKENLEQYLVPD